MAFMWTIPSRRASVAAKATIAESFPSGNNRREIVTPERGSARQLDLDAYLSTHRPADARDADRLAALAAAAGRYAASVQAAATVRKYDAGWAEFEGFCAEFEFAAGPPADVEVVALYLAQMALQGLAVSTQDVGWPPSATGTSTPGTAARPATTGCGACATACAEPTGCAPRARTRSACRC
jgi:hypothetical protein